MLRDVLNDVVPVFGRRQIGQRIDYFVQRLPADVLQRAVLDQSLDNPTTGSVFGNGPYLQHRILVIRMRHLSVYAHSLRADRRDIESDRTAEIECTSE